MTFFYKQIFPIFYLLKSIPCIHVQEVRKYFLQKTLEFLICVCVIAFLSSIALSNYMDTSYSKAKIIHAIGSHSPMTKTTVLYYYGLHGTWPNREETLSLLCQWQPEVCKEDGIKKDVVSIQDGAITLKTSPFDKITKNIQRITLHPAIPTSNPFGPVIWIAGPEDRPGWTVLGKDQTDNEIISIMPSQLK